jgi:cytochrome c553
MTGGPIIEAEQYDSASPIAPFVIQPIPGGGEFIMVPGTGGTMAAADNGPGQAFYPLTATANQITIYATVDLATDITDSFWFQITGLSQWTAQNMMQTAGFQEIMLATINGAVVGQNYTFKVQRREAGAKLDKFRVVGARFAEGTDGGPIVDPDPTPIGDYKGTPYLGIIPNLPGRLEMELYDVGGEGVAYHDTTPTNLGSGGLNTGPGFLDQFRKADGADISYTKFYNNADNSIYNIDQPKENQLYLGWTETGEWTRYTVNVTQTGTYSLDILNSAHHAGVLEVKVDGVKVGDIPLQSNFNAADPIDWRNWHHWRYSKDILRIPLTKGKHVLTFTSVISAQGNYEYIDFNLVATTPTANLVAGKTQYDTLCAACHGAMGEKGGKVNNRAIVNPDTQANLASIIENTMPKLDPSQCVGQCATNIAAYALNGYSVTPK